MWVLPDPFGLAGDAGSHDHVFSALLHLTSLACIALALAGCRGHAQHIDYVVYASIVVVFAVYVGVTSVFAADGNPVSALGAGLFRLGRMQVGAWIYSAWGLLQELARL